MSSQTKNIKASFVKTAPESKSHMLWRGLQQRERDILLLTMGGMETGLIAKRMHTTYEGLSRERTTARGNLELDKVKGGDPHNDKILADFLMGVALTTEECDMMQVKIPANLGELIAEEKDLAGKLAKFRRYTVIADKFTMRREDSKQKVENLLAKLNLKNAGELAAVGIIIAANNQRRRAGQNNPAPAPKPPTVVQNNPGSSSMLIETVKVDDPKKLMNHLLGVISMGSYLDFG